MEREERYLVAKYKDIVKYLTEDEQMQLVELVKIADAGRRADGKHAMQCVVVEQDWPEYEEVWAMIASRADGVPFYKARIASSTGAAPITLGDPT